MAESKASPPRSAPLNDGERDEEVRIEQDLESPEGAPPAPATERRLWIVLSICLFATVVAVFVTLWIVGGSAAIAVGVAMLLAYVVYGGATAIFAVGHRLMERKQIEARVEREHPEHPERGAG